MQVAQQFNAIVMALAGAERIFQLIDEQPEDDEGYVTLVNAKKDAQGNIVECKEHTGMCVAVPFFHIFGLNIATSYMASAVTVYIPEVFKPDLVAKIV